MSAVTKINAHLTSITCPHELRELPAWLIWRYEHHEGEGKPRKVPYYTNGQRRHGVQGRAEDRQQLTTFDAARAAAARRGFDGVGFAPMPEFNVCALDFDRCVQGGEIHPQVLEVLGSTYAEYSPSGLGIRAFFRGNLGNLKDHGEPFGFETFSSKGFVTVTGNALDITQVLGNEDAVAEVDDAVLALVRRRFARVTEPEADATTSERLGLSRSQVEEALDALPGDLDYDQWISVGMALHHELGPEGFQVWDEWSRRSPKYTSERYGRERWRSFGKSGGRQVTARSLVRLAHEHGAHIIIAGPASAEEFDALVEEQAQPEPQAQGEAPKPPRFQFEPVGSFASATASPWIVKGVLPQAGLAVVYGASGSGKSFAVLDMVLAIARGSAWRDRKVRQGKVAYIAAEGADGFRKRLAAYAQHQAIDLATVPMTVLNGAPNLLEVKDAVDLVVGVEAAGGADVIVVDTLAQTMPGGNENAGEDMGKALAHCRRIHQRTGALVILIHHSGKDAAKGARGWSGLRAAADAEIEVLRDEATGQRSLRLSKNKDGEDGLQWGFELQIVQLGVDEDLDPITSCVVAEAELKAPQGGKPMGPVETVVHAVVMEMGEFQSSGIEVDAVIKEAIKRLPEAEEGKRDTRKQRVRRALSTLSSGDFAPFYMDGDCVSVC
jgi:hypothetical protein